MDKGYIHVYTGNGKGKTTAAFGLALRAVCAGKNVFIAQFVKSLKYSETRVQELLANADDSFGKIEIRQLGRGCFLDRSPEHIDVEMAQQALEFCRQLLSSDKWDVVILDEISIAVYFNLLTVQEVVDVLNGRTSSAEVVITGRKAPQEFLDMADLVTDMQEVKHYYQQGVLSRKGIDC